MAYNKERAKAYETLFYAIELREKDNDELIEEILDRIYPRLIFDKEAALWDECLRRLAKCAGDDEAKDELTRGVVS